MIRELLENKMNLTKGIFLEDYDDHDFGLEQFISNVRSSV